MYFYLLVFLSICGFHPDAAQAGLAVAAVGDECSQHSSPVWPFLLAGGVLLCFSSWENSRGQFKEGSLELSHLPAWF